MNSGPSLAVNFEEEGMLPLARKVPQGFLLPNQATSEKQAVPRVTNSGPDTSACAISRGPVPPRAYSDVQYPEDRERQSRASRFEATLAEQAAIWLFTEGTHQTAHEHPSDSSVEVDNKRCIDENTDCDGIAGILVEKNFTKEAEEPESKRLRSFSEGSTKNQNTATASSDGSSIISQSVSVSKP